MISGKDFIEISNIIFCPTQRNLYCRYNVSIINDINTIDKPILYTHTDFIPDLFNILEKVDKKVILISHNSDHNTPNIHIPECIFKWYSQNVSMEDTRLESIPIGIENDVWFPHIGKRNKMVNKLKELKNHRSLLYINHNVNTNPSERKDPYDLFKDKNWTILKNYKNGDRFDEYIDDIYNSKFVLCPNGNGIDTHRLWETLYLKTIPVVKKSINSSFYKELPICFVDNWNDINEIFLQNEYNRISNIDWNLEKLDIEYWKNKIKQWT
jgi:hypothetical protein